MLKISLISLCVCVLFATNPIAKTYYLSPTGNDQSDGATVGTAKFSLGLLADSLSAGDIVYMKGGTYKYDTTIYLKKSGGISAEIKIMAVEGEKPIIDFSIYDCRNNEKIRAAARGIKITGDYWYLQKIEICYAPDNGIKVEGSHNTFDQCLFHHNNDSGIQIGFWKEDSLVDNSKGDLCAYNLVLNCDSYRNADGTYYKDGKPVAASAAYENADGFACKMFAGKGNVFRGCRAWENCDDGWDFYMTEFEIRVENCWSYHNGDQKILGVDSSAWLGDGNGFKLGGKEYPSPNIAINCVAFDAYFGAMCGFNSNDNGTGIRLYNCTAWHCGKNFKMVDRAHVLKNCLAFNPTTSNNNNFNADITEGMVISQNNSWDLTSTVTPGYDDLISTSKEDFLAPRQADGSLPNNGFGRLKAGSDCIDKGVDVGLPFSGSAPDLGAYEFGATGVYRFSKQNGFSAVKATNNSSPVYMVNLAGSRVGKVMNYSAVSNNNQLRSLGSGVYYRSVNNTLEKSALVNLKNR